MAIFGELSAFDLGKTVELFELDLTKFGQPIFRFHNGVNEKYEPVVFNGQTYNPFPCKAEGFEATSSSFARPKLAVANVTGIITAALMSYNQLLGCKFTRRRTFVKYLDEVNFLSTRRNLFTNTSQIGASGWVASRIDYTLSAGAAPDGSNNATLCKESSVVGSSYFYRPLWTFTAGKTYTVSVYVKQYNNQRLTLQFASANGFSGGVSAIFNPSLGTKTGGVMTAVGGGWYRCSLTATCTSTTTVNWIPFVLTDDFSAPAYGLYLWGAQVEEADEVSAYQPVGSSWVQNPTADPTMQFPPDVFYVAQKTKEDKYSVEFELSSAIDLEGVMLPRRQVVSNLCTWKYKGEECGYTGGAVADVNDVATTNPSLDDCSKTVTGCKFRFGENGNLRFGGFVGSALIKAS